MLRSPSHAYPAALLAALLACGLPLAAQAQPGRAPAPAPVPVPVPVPGPAATPPEAPEDPYPAPPDGQRVEQDPRADRAWRLYHRAFAAAAKGQRTEMRSLLAELSQAHPEHPAAALASQLLSQLMDGSGAPGPGAGDLMDTGQVAHGPAAGDLPSGTARAEVALAQTLHGLVVGIELCVFAECDDATSVLGMSVLGAGGGLGASLLLTRDGITSGQSSLVNSGMLWGALHGIMLREIKDISDTQAVTLTLMSSHLVGLGTGALLGSSVASIHEDDVAVANTFGIWSGILSALAMGIADVDVGSDGGLTALLLASDAGLIAGSLMSRRYPMSRGRTLLIDAGGIVGGLTGAGVAVLLGGDNSNERIGLGTTLLGAVIGLGSATYFSQSWNLNDNVPARLTLMPVRDGLGAGLSLEL